MATVTRLILLFAFWGSRQDADLINFVLCFFGGNRQDADLLPVFFLTLLTCWCWTIESPQIVAREQE
jgi:hypothetical protein